MGIPTLIIGVKNRGMVWARALQARPRFRLEGLADIDREVLAARGEELGVPAPLRFADHRSALATGRFQAAVVVVPNHLHYRIGRDVLEAGVHCLMEKPFAETLEQAEELVGLAEAKGLALVIGHNYRFKPQFRAAAGALSGGRLGPLIGVEASFHRHRPPRYEHELAWRYPLLSIQGIHHLDWLLSVLPSAIVDIHCRHVLPPGSPWRSPSVCHLLLGCADGTLVSWRGSYECRGEQTPYNGLWRLECRDGDILIDGDNRVWQVDPAGRRCLYEPAAGEDNGDELLLDTFHEAIAQGREAPTSGRGNLATLRLLFEVIRKGEAAGDREVDVPPEARMPEAAG
jgi:predicted dehydrogenase